MFGQIFTGLSPMFTAGLAVAGSAALVALYLLREHQRRVRVAFLPLWQPGTGSRRIERVGRRLRRWLSLLLQLVMLWLLLLALADPRPAATAEGARTWVVLVDRSASMSARHGDSDRLESARQRASDLVATLGGNDTVMIVSFARGVTAESGFETDAKRLEAALERIRPSHERGDLGRALTFAAAVLRGRLRPTVVVVGDGAHEKTAVDLQGVELRTLTVGTPGDNVAFVSLSARRRLLDPGTVDIGFVVHNFGTTARSLAIEILAGSEGRPIERLPLTLAAGERVARTVAQVFTRQAEIEARLVGEPDLLPLDDRAYAVVPPRPRRKVLIVGGSNLYLDGAVLSFGDAVVATRVTLTAAETMRADWPSYDVVVFDGVTPPSVPTTGRFIYFDPSGPGSPFPERGVVRAPIPSNIDRRHPLLMHVSLADLNIREARRLALEKGDRAVASSFGAPLILTRERPDLKMIALSFDVRRSDLPLRPIFPLLLANAFEWLDTRAAEETTAARTGQVVRIPVPGRAVAVRGPNGSASRHGTIDGFVELALPEQGLYRISAVDDGGRSAERLVVANLADATESDTRARPGLAATEVTLPGRSRAQSWALWALLATAALSLCEWWSHHRRWTV